MKLAALLKRKRLVLLGLNSGTSADGLDLAAVAIDRSRGRYRVKFLSGRMRRYPPAIRKLILKTADSEFIAPEELVRLDQALGQFQGRVAASFIGRLNKTGVKVDAVASHGQTVRHLPRFEKLVGFKTRGTLQLGSPEQIADKTSKVVVADFRQADVAAGNEGAPITGAAMERMVADRKESRLIVNIGGMANFFYFPGASSGLAGQAADCGPGNSLSDILSRKLFNEKYDRGGKQALAGKVSQRLLALLLAEPFFTNSDRSTGREAFGVDLADRVVKYSKKLRLGPNDILATAAELTPVAIEQSVATFVRRDSRLSKLYLTGGGVRNRFFVRRLKEIFPNLEVCSIDRLGFDPDLVEASAFAVMGEACLRSEGLVTCFGAGSRKKTRPVLGRIVQPAQKG
jgi:anhydro-N-acetylmuramic acid kinase